MKKNGTQKANGSASVSKSTKTRTKKAIESETKNLKVEVVPASPNLEQEIASTPILETPPVVATTPKPKPPKEPKPKSLFWREGTSAQTVWLWLAAQKKGATVEQAMAALEGKFETTNLKDRIIGVWTHATLKGIATKDKASKVYKATKTS
jgi:hypothetical protein